MKTSQARKPVCIIPMLKAHHKQVRAAHHLIRMAGVGATRNDLALLASK